MSRGKNQKAVFVLMGILVSLAMIGCQGDPAGETILADLESGEYAVFDFEDTIDAVRDATLEEPMEMDSEICSGGALGEGGAYGRRAPRGPKGPRLERSRYGNHLGAILRELRLTEEQRALVKELMAAHRECVKEPLVDVCEANRELIQEANEQRQAIIEAVKAGEIDHEQAREEIHAINQETREAIREDPANQARMEALCDCKLELFDGIRSVLDEVQLAFWDAWVALLEGPCFVEG